MSLYPAFSFEVTHQSTQSHARIGSLKTPHGVLETPAFIFCATKATVKGLTIAQVEQAGTSIILANTYHLMVQPGADLVQRMGGLHRWMGWKGPMLTDSGGFQIFSLGYGAVADEIKGRNRGARASSVRMLSEEGVVFKSYVNGDKLPLTPEGSIAVQQKLGPDLIVVLDECTPFHVDKTYTASSTRRSHRWALRCLNYFEQTSTQTQALYGIVQGGVYPDLRAESASFVAEQPFFAQAIGGSLGSSKAQMQEVVGLSMSHLPRTRPTHLLGIGGISDILSGVREGIDTFDCVHPTRLARHGGALVGEELREKNGEKEHINLFNARFREDPLPIDPACPCSTCGLYSRSYLHHLFKAREMLGPVAVTVHNVTFMNRLLADIRARIRANKL
jgi:queuine tRNA-ribosyltransferase